MSFKIGGPRRGEDLGAGAIIEHGSHGGLFATILSGVALLISGLSYYETTLKTAELSVFVPPMVSYARDGRDVFNVPLTISNEGARTGTVLTIELDVEKIGGPPSGSGMKSRKFYAAFLGEYPAGKENASIGKAFAPIAIAGHSAFTETVRFYPTDDKESVLVDDKGDYRFTLSLITAKASQPDLVEKALRTDPKPLVFDRTMPYFAIQHIAFRNGVQGLFSKEWNAAQSTSTESAVSRKAPDVSSSAPDAPEAERAPPAPEPAPSPDPAPETGGEATPPAPPPAKKK